MLEYFLHILIISLQSPVRSLQSAVAVFSPQLPVFSPQLQSSVHSRGSSVHKSGSLSRLSVHKSAGLSINIHSFLAPKHSGQPKAIQEHPSFRTPNLPDTQTSGPPNFRTPNFPDTRTSDTQTSGHPEASGHPKASGPPKAFRTHPTFRNTQTFGKPQSFPGPPKDSGNRKRSGNTQTGPSHAQVFAFHSRKVPFFGEPVTGGVFPFCFQFHGDRFFFELSIRFFPGFPRWDFLHWVSLLGVWAPIAPENGGLYFSPRMFSGGPQFLHRAFSGLTSSFPFCKNCLGDNGFSTRAFLKSSYIFPARGRPKKGLGLGGLNTLMPARARCLI